MASNAHDSWLPPVSSNPELGPGARWPDQTAPLPRPESSPLRLAESGPKATTGDWIGGVLISLLFPIIGLIVGLVYFARGGEKRNVGSMCLIVSVVSFLFAWSLMSAVQGGGY